MIYMIVFPVSWSPNNQVEKLLQITFYMFLGFILGVTFHKSFAKPRYIKVEQRNEPNTTNNSRREQQYEMILVVIDALAYQPLAIPTGGKSKIKGICLKRLKLFTDSSFDHAWKEGANKGLFKLLESEKFASNK